MPFRLRSARAIVAASALFTSAAPATAHAQFGALRDRVRRRVESAIEKPSADSTRGAAASPAVASAGSDATSGAGAAPAAAASATAPATPAVRSNPNVVPLTADVIDRVLRGVAAERAHDTQRRTTMAQKTTGGLDGYFHCMSEFDASPEGQQLQQQHLAALRQHSKSAVVASDSAIKRAQAARCGTPEAAAAAATAHDAAARAAQSAAATDTAQVGPTTAGMTPRQFAVARERMIAFALLAGPRGDCLHQALAYAFSSTEASALTARVGDINTALSDDDDVRRATNGYCSPGAQHRAVARRKTA